MSSNPFASRQQYQFSGGETQAVDAQSRLDMVRNMNEQQLAQVLAMKGVQKTVHQAAERRLRKLNKEKAAT